MCTGQHSQRRSCVRRSAILARTPVRGNGEPGSVTARLVPLQLLRSVGHAVSAIFTPPVVDFGPFPSGAGHACLAGMADRFEDLPTWRAMYELSVNVWRITDSGPSSRDRDYRREVREASDSAHRSVACFGRCSPPQFLQFLALARTSAQETRALLRKGLVAGYLSEDQFRHLDILAARGLQSLATLERDLRTPKARGNAAGHRDGQHRDRAMNPADADVPVDGRTS